MSRQKTVFCSILAIGVFIMFNLFGCSSPGEKFDKYQSKNPDIGISMLYPSGWTYSEDRGAIEKYAIVLFLEPTGKNGHLRRSSISVKVVKKFDMPQNLYEAAAVADDLIEKVSKLKDFKLVGKKDSKLLGAKAVDVVFSYKTLDKPLPLIGNLVPARERDIIILKNGKFYFITLSCQEEAFAGLNKIFSYVAKTIKLQK